MFRLCGCEDGSWVQGWARSVSGSASSFHVVGSVVGKNLYLFSGLRQWNLCVSNARVGQSLSANPCLIAFLPLQLEHLGVLSRVGQVLVR